MDQIIIFAIHFLLVITGYLIVKSLGVKSRIESFGLSYLFGSGLVTVLFLANHFFLKMSLGALNFLFSITITNSIATILLITQRKHKGLFSFDLHKFKNKISNLSCLEKIVLFFLSLILAYTLLENYIWPVTDWDALALYDFRARVMAMNGNMLEGIELGYFFQYPPYTSFLHVFGYIFDAERVKIAYSFLYFSLLTVFYSLLRRKQTRIVALLGTLMLSLDSLIFQHATSSYTNLSYVIFVSLGLIYLSYWLFSPDKKDLIVGAILVAISTWIRASDPFWYLGMALILIGLVKNKKNIKLGLGLIFLTLLVYKFWDFFVASMSVIPNSKSSREAIYVAALFSGWNSYISVMKSLPKTLIFFWQNAIHVIKYLLPLGIFTIFYDFKYKNKLNIYMYLLFAAAIFLTFSGVIIFSLFYESWDRIGGSLQRVSMALIPLLVFIIFNSSIWKKLGWPSSLF